MIVWLSTSTISRLRDQLRTQGQKPSVVASAAAATPDAAEAINLAIEYGPLCEAMYLMMSADGNVTDDEREVLRGALRNLSDQRLRSAQIEQMLDSAARKAASHGRKERMDDICVTLREDPARAEVAFILAAAIAFADNQIADAENELLNDLAEGLEIGEERANELLDSVEEDLKSGIGASA